MHSVSFPQGLISISYTWHILFFFFLENDLLHPHGNCASRVSLRRDPPTKFFCNGCPCRFLWELCTGEDFPFFPFSFCGMCRSAWWCLCVCLFVLRYDTKICSFLLKQFTSFVDRVLWRGGDIKECLQLMVHHDRIEVLAPQVKEMLLGGYVA